jgi:hypothetical protein
VPWRAGMTPSGTPGFLRNQGPNGAPRRAGIEMTTWLRYGRPLTLASILAPIVVGSLFALNRQPNYEKEWCDKGRVLTAKCHRHPERDHFGREGSPRPGLSRRQLLLVGRLTFDVCTCFCSVPIG